MLSTETLFQPCNANIAAAPTTIELMSIRYQLEHQIPTYSPSYLPNTLPNKLPQPPTPETPPDPRAPPPPALPANPLLLPNPSSSCSTLASPPTAPVSTTPAPKTYKYIYTYINIYIYTCMCVCVHTYYGRSSSSMGCLFVKTQIPHSWEIPHSWGDTGVAPPRT